MAQLAIVKEGITLNVIEIEPGIDWPVPEGCKLVPAAEAPSLDRYYSRVLPKAFGLSLDAKQVDDGLYIELSQTDDIDLVRSIFEDADGPRMRTLVGKVALLSEHGAIVFRIDEPGVYQRKMSVRAAEQGKGHGGAMLKAALRWMFLKTDAYLISGVIRADRVASKTISARAMGATMLQDRGASYAIYTVGAWAQAYGLQNAIKEMEANGQGDKAKTLAMNAVKAGLL